MLLSYLAPSNSPASSGTETSPVPLSPRRSKSTKSLWCKLYFKLKEINTFDYFGLLIVSGNGFNSPIYESCHSLGEIREMMLPVDYSISLDKLVKDRNKASSHN